MAIITVSDLQDKLEREIAWRKKEIADIRAIATRSSADRHHVYRAGLVMLCAHWEGYLKTAVRRYVEHVLAQRLTIRELVAEFVAVAFYSDVRNAAEAEFPGSRDHHVRLAHRILKGLDEVYDSAGWEVRTNANPSTETTKRLLSSVKIDPSQLGVDAAHWSATQIFIDEHIVGERNKIAHGEGIRLQKIDFLDRTNKMLALLDRLTRLVIHAAVNRDYRI